MGFFRSVVLLISLLVATCATAQTGSQPAQLHLHLPPNVPSENIVLRYVLYGVFGANGKFVDVKADSPAVEIPLAVEGRPADEIKAFAWALGCQIKTFDIRVEGIDTQETYSCDPLPGVLLNGTIQKFQSVGGDVTQIQVDYLAGWACEFFGFADCMVPQFRIGSTKPDSTGRFELEVPDFASDPACNSSRSSSAFQLTLREVKTKNIVAFLNPEPKDLQAPGGIKPASEYPNSTPFIVAKQR